MSQTITIQFDSQPWDTTPRDLGVALEHDHAIAQYEFKGDIVGTGTGSYVVTYLEGRQHFSYSGQIVFEGSILGKKGTILIRESGWAKGNRSHSSWIFDTFSGAGELQGLAGEGSYDSTPSISKKGQEVTLHVSFA